MANTGSNIMLFNFKLFSRVYYSFILLFLNILGGSIGFMLIEGFSPIDSFYQTIITISTVGFNEVKEFSDAGKLFVSFLIITSFGTFAYAISSITTYIVSGDYRRYFKDFKNMKGVGELNDHAIVCGYGRVGRQAVETLKAHKVPFIVIEQKDAVIEMLRADGVFYAEGDATQDDLLKKVGIDKAKALITTLPSDSDNTFVVLTARELNKKLSIIARASISTSIKKLKIAGANNVIMPDSLGGSHMAQLVSNPDVLEFLDQISIQGENEINLEEIRFTDIPEGYRYKSLADLKKQFPYINIVGLKNNDNDYTINPSENEAILPQTKIFVLGSKEQIQDLNAAIGL